MSISSNMAASRGRLSVRLLQLVAVGAGSLFLGACSGVGGDEPLGEIPSGVGEDGGELTPPPYTPGGAVIASLQTANPDMDSFLVRGTIPVPKGTYPRTDNRVPFTLLDWDGSPIWTQVEIVSRYANAVDGADVVEVMGRVRPHPGVPVGQQVSYLVEEHLLRAETDPALPNIFDLSQPRAVLPYIIELVTDPEGIEIAAYDVFGHKYVAKPLDGTGTTTHRRVGRARSELRIAQNLIPVTPIGGANATLPHLFGVHTYITTYTGQEILGLEIRFHNGHSGLDNGTSEDDPLDRIYFQRIEITIPETYHIQQQFEDPSFRPPFRSGGRRIARFVDAIPNGQAHVMRWLGQFHRRMMISTTAALDIARNYLDGAGQAFCEKGLDPTNSHQLYSWWNPNTARYFTQKHQLPSLDHVNGGIWGIRNALNSQHDSIENNLIQGTGQGGYPIPYGTLGWMHAYGVTYGGMTGGAEIFLYDGIGLAATGTPRGFRYYQALHRMTTSRQSMALYNEDGRPSSVEDWLIGSPGSPSAWVPMNHFQVPNTNNQDPFGLGNASQHQVTYAAVNGLAPWYQGTHLTYDPIDYQHFIRYTRAAKVLAWLGNDSIAKDDILAMAEAFNLSYHPYSNNSGGGYQSTGMKFDRVVADNYPGLGMPFGRGESWGSNTMVAAYALGDPAWRATKLPWFQALAELLADAQSSCTGFIQAQHMGSVPVPNQQPTYFWRQLIEQSITENMLRGLKETVFEGADTSRAQLVRDTLVNSAYAMISPLAWENGVSAPWQYTAVGMNPDALAMGPSTYWCTVGDRPANGRTTSVDNFQNWSSFAYGYELTGDPAFLSFAELQLPGNGGLLLGVLSQGTENIENLAALVALVQAMNGIL